MIKARIHSYYEIGPRHSQINTPLLNVAACFYNFKKYDKI